MDILGLARQRPDSAAREVGAERAGQAVEPHDEREDREVEERELNELERQDLVEHANTSF